MQVGLGLLQAGHSCEARKQSYQSDWRQEDEDWGGWAALHATEESLAGGGGQAGMKRRGNSRVNGVESKRDQKEGRDIKEDQGRERNGNLAGQGRDVPVDKQSRQLQKHR